jgi:hypothetical protein
MKKLEEALFEYTSGGSEVEDITHLYDPTVKKISEIKEELQADACKIAQCDSGACEVSCQSAYQMQDQSNYPIAGVVQQQQKEFITAFPPTPPPKKEEEVPVVPEDEKVICTECEFLFTASHTQYCSAERKRKRDPISGEWENTGDTPCYSVGRNIHGNCPLYTEIPPCDLPFSGIEKSLYRWRLLKVWWDGDKRSWNKRIGWRKADEEE